MHIFNQQLDFRNDVLIVAKCIVNVPGFPIITIPSPVLIVAKCIVNGKKFEEDFSNSVSINSSKVYCK